MVFFIELAFFILALAILLIGEMLGARVALALVVAVLAISYLARRRYASAPAATPTLSVLEPAASAAAEHGLAGAHPKTQEALEAIAFRDELLRSWRHFNLLLLLGCPFILGWVFLTS